MTAQNIGGTEVKVVVNIGRAIDMPVRSVSTLCDSTISKSGDIIWAHISWSGISPLAQIRESFRILCFLFSLHQPVSRARCFGTKEALH